MDRRRRSRLVLPLLLVVIVGCSTGGTTGNSASGTGQPAGGASPTPAGGGGGGGGGSIAGIDSCALLTPAEIEQALGSAMSAGKKVSVSGDSSGCDWDAQAATAGLSVGIRITPFSQDLWSGETAVTGTVAVPGIGEAAFRGFVSPGVMLIKKGAMEIDVQIVSVFLDEKKMEAGQETLAKLIVSRL